jgi:hypothetical protein
VAAGGARQAGFCFAVVSRQSTIRLWEGSITAGAGRRQAGGRAVVAVGLLMACRAAQVRACRAAQVARQAPGTRCTLLLLLLRQLG